MQYKFIKFFIYKDVWLIFIGAWITIALVSVLGIFFDAGAELGSGIILSLILLPLLINSYKYYRKERKEEGKAFFFSKVGYIALGINLGWIIISTIFNLFYEPGWFDFRDFGFVLASYPLIIPITTFANFQFNTNVVSSRLILYLISFANLAIITFALDCFGVLWVIIYSGIKKLLKS